MRTISRRQKENLDMIFGGILIGSAMTFGLILLGFTVYRDVQGVNNYEVQKVSSFPSRPEEVEPLDDLPNPPYVHYLDVAPPSA